MRYMTQADEVMGWFELHKYLNRAQAMQHLNIFNLTAVISDMRESGIQIETVYETKNGKKSKWCKYALKQAEKGEK